MSSKISDNFPAGNYMFKVNNRNTRTRCEICTKLTIKRPEQRQAISDHIIIPVNFEDVKFCYLFKVNLWDLSAVFIISIVDIVQVC